MYCDKNKNTKSREWCFFWCPTLEKMCFSCNFTFYIWLSLQRTTYVWFHTTRLFSVSSAAEGEEFSKTFHGWCFSWEIQQLFVLGVPSGTLMDGRVVEFASFTKHFWSVTANLWAEIGQVSWIIWTLNIWIHDIETSVHLQSKWLEYINIIHI